MAYYNPNYNGIQQPYNPSGIWTNPGTGYPNTYGIQLGWPPAFYLEVLCLYQIQQLHTIMAYLEML